MGLHDAGVVVSGKTDRAPESCRRFAITRPFTFLKNFIFSFSLPFSLIFSFLFSFPFCLNQFIFLLYNYEQITKKTVTDHTYTATLSILPVELGLAAMQIDVASYIL
jgi:hypothetical protein